MSRWLAALSLALALSLTGCWNSAEVNNLAIVDMMGLDRTEAGLIKVWLQVVLPPRVVGAERGGGAGASQGQSFIVVTGQGRTVTEAARSIQRVSPRRIFWAHIRVIVLGERLAGAGVRPVLDFLTRQREMRPTNYLLVVPGDLAEFMATPVEADRLPGDYLWKIKRARTGTTVTVGDFSRLLAARGADPVLGVARVNRPAGATPTGQKPTLRLAGTALFRGDRMVGVIDDRLTRGLTWLRGEPQRGAVTFPAPKRAGYLTLEWTRNATMRRARLEGGRIVLEVGLRVEGALSEATGPLDLSDPELLNRINDRARADIEALMAATLGRLRALNVDAAGLGEVVRQQQPAIWRQVEKRWLRQEFRRARVRVTVEARVRRTGITGQPRGFRTEELIKGEK